MTRRRATAWRRRGYAALAAATIVGSGVVGAPARAASNTGTEFWAVDLDNVESGMGGSFAIVVANNSDAAASVTVSDSAGPRDTATVAPNAVHTFRLPRQIVDGTRLTNQGVYRVTSDADVVAYQFNPIDNAYTNDASLLLPTTTLGTNYVVASREQQWASYLRGFAAVVATQPGLTHVRITPTAATLEGDVLGAEAGAVIERDLNQFEVLNIESRDVGGDLTGTIISSDKPVAAFGGSECSFVPDGVYACDHLEEQMLPTVAWGKQFDVCRSARGLDAPDRLRVIAREDGTTLTSDPPNPGLATSLDAGQWAEVTLGADVALSASAPVSVMQYTASQGEGSTPGDPSMITVVPTEQRRTDYLVLTPDTFANDFVTLATRPGGVVQLDGQAVDEAASTEGGNGSFRCNRVPVGDGSHRLTSSTAFGVTVEGYDQYASYGYPGGLDVKKIHCTGNATIDALGGETVDGVLRPIHEGAADQLLEAQCAANGTPSTPVVPDDPGVVVSLGDSYSSGEGNGPRQDQGDYDPGTDVFVPIPGNARKNGCHRADEAWPRQLGVTMSRHLACSGAVIGDLYSGQEQLAPDNAGQIERLKALERTTKIKSVTVTIGGNDLGFETIASDCYFIDCLRHVYEVEVPRARALRPRLAQAYRDIADAAPGARVVVVGYPKMFPDDGEISDCLWLTQAEKQRIETLSRTFNAQIHSATLDAGVVFVDTAEVLDDHEVCTSESWMVPVGATVGIAKQEMLHPIKRGQEAIKDAVAGRV